MENPILNDREKPRIFGELGTQPVTNPSCALPDCLVAPLLVRSISQTILLIQSLSVCILNRLGLKWTDLGNSEVFPHVQPISMVLCFDDSVEYDFVTPTLLISPLHL